MITFKRQSRLRAFVTAALIPAMATVWSPQRASANPSGADVRIGDIQINLDGDTMSILQSSNKAIINWESFSIGKGEKTVFQMPSNGANLSRVTGGSRSDIQGMLKANGNLFLINPNGILFGGGAVIDVNGMVASTLDIANEDFLDGGAYRLAGSSTASVVNMGTFTVADGGEVILAAREIRNEGQILGGIDTRVVLIGANEALVHPGKFGNVIISGTPAGSVVNTGTIEAAEVRFEAMSIYANAIQNRGAIRANKAETGNGRVVLRAMGGGGIENSADAVVEAGTVDHGGEIVINTEGLFRNSGRLDASGALTGGSITMTGGEIAMEAGSLLDARGGQTAGNVTVSSPGAVKVDGEIDASSAIGRGGRATMSAGEISIGQLGVVDVSGAAEGGIAALSASGGVKIDGAVRADSSLGEGGLVKIQGSDVTASASSFLSASGVTGGQTSLDASGATRVDGHVMASGSTGAGGKITLTGNSVSVLASADVNADGASGGNIFIGGGFQGNDGGLRESIYTSIADGSQISAKGTVGRGGNVVAWSNGATDFYGNVDATGQTDGGLVEISGVQSLGFYGTVDTSGVTGRTGTLLLDPNNVTLGPTGITSGALSLAVVLNNVVIHTNGTNGQLGIITVADGFDMRYNSANSLTLLAHSDINVGGIIKNHGAGNINLFAGWDGTGASSLTPSGALGGNSYDSATPIGIAQLVGAGALFGAYGTGDQGNVTLNPNSNSVVNVGSAGGETNVLGSAILLNTGDTDGEFTQIGYRPEDVAGGATIGGLYAITETGVAPTGNINVYSNRNLIMLSNGLGRYTHIGHGGQNQDDRMNAADSWQIEVPDVDLSGDIRVHAGGALIMSGGNSDGGYSMIGHGGFADDNVAAGTPRDTRDFRRIDASARGNISIDTLFLQMQSGGVRSQVQIGHGGYSVHGEHTGHIDVVAHFGVSANAGGAPQTDSNFDDGYVMIGHGGGGARDSGTTIATLQQAERGADHQYTLPRDLDGISGIQAGPDGILGTADDFGEGILTVDIANMLIATNGAGTPWAPGGSGAAGTAGTYNTALLPEAGLSATTGEYRKVGAAGNISVTSPNGSISFMAGGVRAFAKIGHGGYYTSGEFGGWDIDNADGDNDWATGADGDITVTAAGDIIFDRVIRGQNNSGQLQFAGATEAFNQIGHGGYVSSGGGHGNITVTAQNGAIEFYGGRSNSFAQIGHGGRSESAGPIATFLQDARVHLDDFAQGTHTGDITVNASGDIIFRSGFGHGSLQYSQIGHGGYRNFAMANEGFNGNILVNSGGNIDFFAGPKVGELRPGQVQDENNASDTYTMIGHGGRDSKGDHWGSITVAAAGDLAIEATGGWNAIGYGDNPATTNPNPPNLFNESGDTAITGDLGTGDESGIPGYGNSQNSSVVGDRNFATIGHGGYDSEHFMPTSGDLRLATGSNSVGFGVLGLLEGHRADGAILAEGDPNRVESNITLTAGGDFRLIAPQLASRSVQSSLFLSYDADGELGTSDLPFLDPITGLALPGAVNNSRDSWANVGHGGRSSEIRSGMLPGGLAAGHYGDITVTAGGQIDVIATDFFRSIEAGLTGDPNTWVTGDSTGNSEYFDLAFWLDGQDGTIDGRDDSARVGGTGYTHTPLGDLSVLFPGYIFQDALDQMEIDAEDGIMTIGRFNYRMTSGNDMIFGTDDDGLASFLNMSASLETNNGFAKIGHGGFDSSEGAMQGDITVTSTGGGLNLVAGNSVRSFAHIGHGGDDGTLDRLQPVEGHINVDVAGDINVTGGKRTFAWAMIGHGGNTFTSSLFQFQVRNADISVISRLGDIAVTGGEFNPRDVVATNSQIVNNAAQFAKIGHGGWDMDMDAEGDITVLAQAGSISLTGNKARGNFAQIGHGATGMDAGPLEGSSMNGNIAVDAFGSINLTGGDAPTYSDLASFNHDLEGDPIFPENYYPDQEFSVTVSGSTGGQYAYAQIGHGGYTLGSSTRGTSISGNIDVNSLVMDRAPDADINLRAGDGDGSYALIGHGGSKNELSETFTGNINVHSNRDINLVGGLRLFNGGAVPAYNAENFAQIGHSLMPDNVGVAARGGNSSGSVTVTALNDILLQAGGGAASHAKIGHGANFNYLLKNPTPGLINHIGDHLGNITVVTGGDLIMLGAAPLQADPNTQSVFGVFDPNIGNNLPGLFSPVQIGHGGPGVSSNAGGHSGNIDVRVGGTLTMTSGQTRNGYAKIGHGDYMYSNPGNAGLGFRSGNISVAVGESAVLTGAQIGHVDDRFSNAIGVDGSTYIATGRNINAVSGNLSLNSLSANPAMGFGSPVVTSLGSGFTGELRMYMSGRLANLIDAGMLLNNSAYQIPLVPPYRADEAAASEFGFDYVDGLPQGAFGPNGVYSPSIFGRYTIFYGPLIGGTAPPVTPGPGGGGGGEGPGGGGEGPGVIEPLPPVIPLPPIPGLPPTLPEGGLTELQLALIAAYFGGNIPAELNFLLEPDYQRNTGIVNTGFSTEGQFTVTSQMGFGSVNGGTPPDGTITIYSMDNGAQPADFGTFSNSEEDRRRREAPAGSTSSDTPSEPAQPPTETEDTGMESTETPPAGTDTPPAQPSDPFSFQ